VFGAKLMWAYTQSFLNRLRELDATADNDAKLIGKRFPDPRFIWTRRDDVEAQAVSWAKAIQTGYWHRWDRAAPDAELSYDRHQIDALARAVETHNAAWQRWFTTNGIEPFTLIFEELVADPRGAASAALGS
jgi:LPS sulfotransferase NodH